MLEQKVIKEDLQQDILDYINNKLLSKRKDVEAVFLVGSASRGEFTPVSDIDLLILSSGNLSNDVQDNMMVEHYRNREFSLIFTNFDFLKDAVANEIPATITFIMDAKKIYDPKNLLVNVKELLENFKLTCNLSEELASVNQRLKSIETTNDENKNFNILMSSIDLAREFLCLKNDPFMSTKHIFKHLNVYNKGYASSFFNLWNIADDEIIISVFEHQIESIDRMKDSFMCKNNSINIVSRLENAKDALKGAKFFASEKRIEAKLIALSESYYLHRGVMEYLGHEFDTLQYENFFKLLELESNELYTDFKRIWSFFDPNELNNVFREQIAFLSKILKNGHSK